MRMVYTIESIIEPDFGCEGLPEGEERMDTVVLRGEGGALTVRVADALLYRLRLDVGSRCTFDGGVISPTAE